MKALVFSDLHFGKKNTADKLERLIQITERPDVVLLCGDNAELELDFSHHRLLFQALKLRFECPIAFIAGNHDLWGRTQDISSETLLYRRYPILAKQEEVTYLETGNLTIGDWTIAGTYGHYDFSFRKTTSLDDLRAGEITIGNTFRSWADKTYMVWKKPDEETCHKLLDDFEKRLPAGKLITLTHTIPSLAFNGWPNSPAQDFLASYSGSKHIGEIIENRQPEYHFCGHTHKYVQGKIGETIVTNVGADYNILSYLVLDTEKGVKRRKVKI